MIEISETRQKDNMLKMFADIEKRLGKFLINIWNSINYEVAMRKY